jgi:hypothetical protein
MPSWKACEKWKGQALAEDVSMSSFSTSFLTHHFPCLGCIFSSLIFSCCQRKFQMEFSRGNLRTTFGCQTQRGRECALISRHTHSYLTLLFSLLSTTYDRANTSSESSMPQSDVSCTQGAVHSTYLRAPRAPRLPIQNSPCVMPPLTIISLPLTDAPPGYAWSERALSDLSTTTAFKTGLNERDIFFGQLRCIICGTGIPNILQHCLIIPKSEGHTVSQISSTSPFSKINIKNSG